MVVVSHSQLELVTTSVPETCTVTCNVKVYIYIIPTVTTCTLWTSVQLFCAIVKILNLIMCYTMLCLV